MIFASCHKTDIESVLQKARLYVWALAGCACLGGIWIFFQGERLQLSHQATIENFSHDKELHLEEIGRGALALHPPKRSSLVPDLSREIIVLARSSRPDCDPKESTLLLSTKSGNEKRIVAPGEQIFLKCHKNKDEESTYSFSDKKTPLWIRPMLNSSEDICFEVGFFTPSKQNEGFFEEISQVIIQQVKSSLFKEKNENAFLSSIRQAKWWGNDSLFTEYGGKEYKDIMHKQKVEIPSEVGPQFYFLEAGDYLVWEEGKWQKTSLREVSAGFPLAQVKRAEDKVLEMQVWDEKGFYPQTLRFDLQPSSKLSQKSDLHSASVRLRSSSQVVCSIGKRRLILKEGDWIMKVGRSWRVVKRNKDINDCLEHKLRGELFIFDSIDKQQGKLFLKGHLFDEMRTQMTPVSLPISSEDPASAKGKKSKASPLLKKKAIRKGKNER